MDKIGYIDCFHFRGNIILAASKPPSMYKRLLPFSLLLLAGPLFAQQYKYAVDIKNIQDDKVNVELVPPVLKENQAVFSFARVIPGSYSEKSFGKYIEDFTALDKDGKALKVKKLNANQYEVQDAGKLALIRYRVNDTWDTPDKDFIFQPGGSNIESGNNIVMNNHAFYGYFEGYSKLPFQVKVTKPAELYASTHLNVDRKNSNEDWLSAKDYVYLADNPVIYCKPDTTSFQVGKSRINISTYSATGMVKSEQLAGYLKPMANALQEFFHGLPVDSYQFLFYFEDPEKALTGKENDGGGYGALEHNYSSLYFLPEIAYEPRLKSMVNDVTSHEFLHILTPLNLHSEHIENFDFVNPIMSKHLWLYEGVTEYFSNLVQLQSGIITEKKFFENMRDKINEAAEYGDFAMTKMSEQVLDANYQPKYASVYNRGALLGLMLDITIRENTNQQKDLKSVMMGLAGKYGAGKPFTDNTFLAEFVQASHPAVATFIANYIDGDKPLPYAETFEKLGYEFKTVKRIDVYYNGNAGLTYNDETKSFVFADVKSDNTLGLQDGDVFVSVDGIVVTEQNIDEVWEKYFDLNRTKPKITVVVKRDGNEKTLDKPLRQGYAQIKNYLGPLESPSPQQKVFLERLRK